MIEDESLFDDIPGREDAVELSLKCFTNMSPSFNFGMYVL